MNGSVSLVPCFRNLVFVSAALLGLNQAAAATKIKEVQLKSPLFGHSYVTLEVRGTLPDDCHEIVSFRQILDSDTSLVKDIDVHLEVNERKQGCAESTEYFSRSLFLGDLTDGLYTVNVFKNNNLVLERDIEVPGHVRRESLDLNMDQAIGLHRTLLPDSEFRESS